MTDHETSRQERLEAMHAEYDEAMSRAMLAQTYILRTLGEEALKNVVILPLPHEGGEDEE